jgi:anti-sigma B factor antagonist
MTNPGFGVSVTELPGEKQAVLSLSGELDISAKEGLRELFDAQLKNGRSTIVVDLHEVSFIDSVGLGVLVGALRRCRENDGDLRLVTESPRLLQLFDITGLDRVFSISPSVEAAVSAGQGSS